MKDGDNAPLESLGPIVRNKEARSRSREDRRVKQIQADRLAQLAKHHGAFKNGRVRWRDLATALGALQFPALRIQDGVPMPEGTIADHRYNQLWLDVHGELQEGKLTKVAAVLRDLVRQKGGRWYGQNPDSLRQRLHEFQRLLNEHATNVLDYISVSLTPSLVGRVKAKVVFAHDAGGSEIIKAFTEARAPTFGDIAARARQLAEESTEPEFKQAFLDIAAKAEQWAAESK